MSDLIERLSKVAGPSRSLDREIALAIGWQHILPSPYSEHAAIWISPTGARSSELPPNYTFTLDAAIKLIPEGCDWIIGHTNGGLAVHAEVGGTGPEHQCFGETPPLAVCAAALKARAMSAADGAK